MATHTTIVEYTLWVLTCTIGTFPAISSTSHVMEPVTISTDVLRAIMDRERHIRPPLYPSEESHQWDPRVSISTSNVEQMEPGNMASTSTVDMTEHCTGNTDWCSCGRCVSMPTEIESIFCREINNIEPLLQVNNICVCELQFVQRRLLDPEEWHSLHSYAAIYRSLHLPRVQDLSARFHIMHLRRGCMVILPRNRRIPSCVVCCIQSMFPEPDSVYVGFHTAYNDGPAINMLFD
ncbi:LOW QUALITY PROTEIN: uncharacterized protein O3C94_011772 [Discoglossus pictus]